MKSAALFSMLLLAVGCQSVAPPAPGLATLRVHVQAEPKTGAAPSPQKVNVYDTPPPTEYGDFAKVDYSDLDQIVVWLEPVSTAAPPVAKSITVQIDPSKASTHVSQVASTGEQLLLHNASSQPQRIYSVSDGNDFDLESVPPGGRASYTIRSPGLIEILTGDGKPTAEIYAAPTSWVAVARSGESIAFANLPPGQYRLVSWHPRLPGSTENVTLAASQVTDASIDVTVNSLPKVGSSQ